MLQTIPSELYQATFDGLNLRSGTLAEQLAGGLTLLVFLRHFGCPFCKETVIDLKTLSAENPAFPRVVFVSQCSSHETQEFFAKRWPEARVICDPEKTLYTALGLRRGSLGQIMGLRVWACSMRALVKGHMMTKPVGDPWLMPGAFLVQGDQIVWAHRFKHQGDRPDWRALPGVAQGPGRKSDAAPPAPV